MSNDSLSLSQNKRDSAMAGRRLDKLVKRTTSAKGGTS